MTDLIIRGRRVVTPEGVRAASVHVAEGLIVRVGAWEKRRQIFRSSTPANPL